MNLKQGTCGELFGYGYLPLPLTPAKTTTAGKDIPTGDQSWTLFLNTRNFKGPVAFFTPYFWSAGAVADPRFSGMLLDSRPSNPNRALQMETQHVPSIQAVDAKGETYARIAPTFFPCETNGESRLVHHITSYNKQALWDAVKTWFDGGAEASGDDSTCRRHPASVHRQRRGHLEDLSGRYSQGRESAPGVDFLRNADGGESQYLRLSLGSQSREADRFQERARW